MSAAQAFDAFQAAASAYARGDTEGMRKALLEGSLDALGAIPVLGGAVKLTRATARLAELAIRLARPVGSRLRQAGKALGRLGSSGVGELERRRAEFRSVLGDDYARYLKNADADLAANAGAGGALPSGAGGLADEERVALNLYTTEAGSGATYKVVNGALRDGTWRNDRRTAAIVGMMDEALERLPAYEGRVYRAVNLPEEEARRLVPGGDIADPGFMSTSIDRNAVPEGRKYLFEINALSGRDIAPYSRFQSEAEILIPRATMFDILDVTQEADGTIKVIMKEQPQ
jgi:hypothetical protein